MESFLSTLLGAFLGVGLPVLIGQGIEQGRYMKLINLLFIKSNVYYQSLLNFLRAVGPTLPPTSRDPEVYRKFIKMNIMDRFELSSSIPETYYRFISSENQFLLLQADQNVRVLHEALLLKDFSFSSEVVFTIENLVEMSARRSWIVFLIASKAKIEFSKAKFDSLVGLLNGTKNKNLFKIKAKKIT